MSRIISWLHCPPMGMLIVAALLLGSLPITPEPHLFEKIRMLLDGTLVKPVDMFDLFWHSWPILWIILRLLTPGAGAQCRIPDKS